MSRGSRQSEASGASKAMVVNEPTDEQVEAAARAWMAWQFPGRDWDDAVSSMKKKFLTGARRSLIAAAYV